MFKPHVYSLIMMSLLVFSGCATLLKDFDRPLSYTFTDTGNTALGKMVADERAANPFKSGYHLLANGLDAFVARALLAHYAERSIDVQY